MRHTVNRTMIWGLVSMMLTTAMLLAVSVAAQAPIVYQQAAVGQSVSFSGTGFTANEQVALWTTAPDKSVTPLPGNQADAHGAVSTNVSFLTDGFWQVTAHGINSGKEVISGYTIGTAANTTPGAAVTPASTPTGTTTVTLNQATTFSHGGFQALEPVSFWTTAPDGKATALDGASADQSGNIVVAVSFPTSGYWQVTAHGLDSAREAIGGFNVGDLTTAPTSASAAVIATPSVFGTPAATVIQYPGMSSPLSTAALTPPSPTGLVQPGGAVSTYTIGPVPSSTGKQPAGA